MADAPFAQHAKEMNEQKHVQLVKDMQKVLLQKAWWLQGLWWSRLEVRSARIRNYQRQPSHWMNRRFEDLWLAAK